MTSRDATDLIDLLRRHALERGGDFELSSGGESSVYVDVKQVSLTGRGAAAIGRGFWEVLQRVAPQAAAVGGMTLGADPLVTATTLAARNDGSDLSALIVRKAQKGHGTGKRVEAPDTLEAGAEILAVDDVCTTGGSTIEAIEQMREAGFRVDHAVCVVDREAGATANLADIDVELHSLFRLSELT